MSCIWPRERPYKWNVKSIVVPKDVHAQMQGFSRSSWPLMACLAQGWVSIHGLIHAVLKRLYICKQEQVGLYILIENLIFCYNLIVIISE